MLRAVVNVFLRDIGTYFTTLDIIRGVPAMYTLYAGFDEVAHHSGPYSNDTNITLRQFDRQVARIKRVIEEKAPRPNEILILSDHGQSFGPTFKQRYGISILEFIQQRQDTDGMAPSIREIAAHFRFRSPNAVTAHLAALRNKGALQRIPHRARSLQVVNPYAPRSTFKYYGNTGAPDGAPCGISVPAGVISTADGTAAKDILAAMDLSFDPAATYRLYVGSRTSDFHYNAIEDFQGGTPATPLATLANQVVTSASCDAYHGDSQNRTSLFFRNVENPGNQIHGGNRFKAEVCVVCHNGSWYNRDESTTTKWVTELDLPQLVHRLHGGDEEYMGGRYEHLHYFPQPVTNCRTCHDNQRLAALQPAGRPDVDKNGWKDRPSQQACGTCHNGQLATAVDFQDHFIVQDDKVRPVGVRCGLPSG